MVLLGEIKLLNLVIAEPIHIHLRWYDILIGLTIYLKTSIDFAIYIGRLMSHNRGYKSRIAIELGTAIGNAAGTFAILAVWAFFKEVKWLLALMIFLAALVLFRLAQDSLEHAKSAEAQQQGFFARLVRFTEVILEKVNRVIAPVLKFIVPNLSTGQKAGLKFPQLFWVAFTVPFILGLDDFAGYVPLFSIVNVLGFAIGVFAGHMILNMLLYISPAKTIKIVKNPLISFLGALAFIGLGIWGLLEVIKIIGH